MAGFWSNYKKKYITEPVQRKNGYYELSDSLQKKVDFFQSDYSSKKYSDYFTWDEFYEFVTKTTYLHLFFYDGKEYGLEIGKKHSYFYTESIYVDKTKKENGFSEIYKTPQELLQNARIDGKSLQEIWGDLFVN